MEKSKVQFSILNSQFSIIKVASVNKKFGELEALKNISFEVSKGEIFGLIGPDGAGKTTLFRILTSLILADSGTAFVDGLDVVKDYAELRKHIGYMPGRFSLYQDLSVEENLSFYATIFNTTIQENYYLIKDIYQHIEPFKHRRAGKLSGGMKQKLALSCALIHKPAVLFLDEPTTGVDPVSRKEFWEMLRRLKNDGITIVVSTPYMDEANLCDRIALIQNGQIFSIETPENIVKQFPKKLYKLESDNNYLLLEELRTNPQIESVVMFGDNLHATFKNDEAIKDDVQLKMDILQFINANKKMNHPFSNIHCQLIQPSVEDCFIALNLNQ